VSKGDENDESHKAGMKALNDVNMPRNSQFALAIIQNLLASNGASAFQAIESVNLCLLSFLFIGLRGLATSKKKTK